MRYKGVPPYMAAAPGTSPEPRFSNIRLLPILGFIDPFVAGESKKDLSFGGGVAFYAAWSREALNRTGISLCFDIPLALGLCCATRTEARIRRCRLGGIVPGRRWLVGRNFRAGDGTWLERGLCDPCEQAEWRKKRGHRTVHQHDRGVQDGCKIRQQAKTRRT